MIHFTNMKRSRDINEKKGRRSREVFAAAIFETRILGLKNLF